MIYCGERENLTSDVTALSCASENPRTVQIPIFYIHVISCVLLIAIRTINYIIIRNCEMFCCSVDTCQSPWEILFLWPDKL